MYLFEKNPFSTWDLSVSCWTEIRRATISFAISFFLSIHRKKSTVPTVNLSAEMAMTSVFSSTVAVGAVLYACPHDLKNRIPHRFFIHIVGRWTFLRNVRAGIKRCPYTLEGTPSPELFIGCKFSKNQRIFKIPERIFLIQLIIGTRLR